MAALIRCGLNSLRTRGFTQSIIKPRLSLPHSLVKNGLPPMALSRLLVTSASAVDKLLDDVHRKMDYNQGIPIQLFETLITSLEDHGTLVEQDIGLLLHICSTGPFDCSTGKRLEFVEEIWNKLEKHGISPSTKLYNIRLKAYCKNNKDFNALDELLTMKTLGLNPDKVTYSLLVEGFCMKGDIDGANSVLEAMKTAQLAINVNVFNSFITGHLKAGSPDEAAKVLELISSSGLNPNSQTYFKFASFYAEEGDVDSLVKYLNEAEALGIPLDHSMLLDLHRTMVTNGHSSGAAQLLQTISEQGIFSSSFLQKSCHLVAEGFVDAAVDLYIMMPKLEDGKIVSNSGNFLVKTMVVNGHSAEDIFTTADRIVEICPRSLVHRNMLLFAYRAGQTDLAMEILGLMVSKNHTIKVPYVVPAICSYRKEKNAEGIYKATEMLLKISPAGIRDDKFDQLIRCSYPALLHCKQSRENIVERFKQHEKLWNSIFFLDDLQAKGFDAAITNAEGKNLDGAVLQWTDGPNSFIKYLHESGQHIDSCVKALEFLNEQPHVDQENFNYLTSRLVRFFISQRFWSALEQFLDGLLEKKLFLVQSLKQAMVLRNAPESVKEKLDQLCVGTGISSNQGTRKSRFLSLAQLEEMSEEAVRTYQKKNPDRFLPRVVLLEKAMNANDLESTKQILREIQALGFSLTLVQTMKVITNLIKHKDIETAMIYFEELKKATGDSYRATIPLMIGEECVKQGNVKGALDMIADAKKSEFPMDLRAKMLKRRLLDSILKEAPTFDDASTLHSAMFHPEPILLDNEGMFLHRSYIRRMSTTEDDAELVNTLLNVYQKYRIFPLHDLVLERLIKKKDVANLKKVMDIGNAVFGSNYFHHKLAFNFIRCGMPARGATILNTPGLNLNERLISTTCQSMIKGKEIDVLESLVTVMKEMPISQANMLNHLVEGYVSVDNLKQATETVQQFALDYNLPPRKTVEFLIKAYESSSEDVPEVLMSLSSKFNQSSTQSQRDSSLTDSNRPISEGNESPDRTDSVP